MALIYSILTLNKNFFEAGTNERIESIIIIECIEHKDVGPGRGQS